ncbi:Rhodanese-like domain-containing protein [Pyrenochaeta sp. MPI-SDFR-AT-0127]|nr:Rhodanese-like domain-containing protein [Pyrenochaeta sp. MPI-SDFR-AT-0127]
MRPLLLHTSIAVSIFQTVPPNLVRAQHTLRCMDLNHVYTHQHRNPTSNRPSKMSNISLSDLQFISREELAQDIQKAQSSSPSSSLPPSLAVVDVRDSDHIGGHIRGSTWLPSNELDYKTPELVRTLRDKDVVVFHCALSQQRGPSAALRYLREKQRLDPGSGVESKREVKEGEGEVQKEADVGAEQRAKKKQKVYVLRGGFTEWQEKYGADERLTEGWQKDIWEFGY